MNIAVKYIDNSSLKGREESFEVITLDIAKVVAGWKASLFSFEWLTREGCLHNIKDLGEERTALYNKVEDTYKAEKELERPVLGIGMMDNIEIGSRKEILLTLYNLGVETIEVHVPKSCYEDFQKFM